MARFVEVKNNILAAKAQFSTHPEVDWGVEPFKTVDQILMQAANDCECVEMWPCGLTMLKSAAPVKKPAPKRPKIVSRPTVKGRGTARPKAAAKKAGKKAPKGRSRK
jgi:hypothetical protein